MPPAVATAAGTLGLPQPIKREQRLSSDDEILPDYSPDVRGNVSRDKMMSKLPPDHPVTAAQPRAAPLAMAARAMAAAHHGGRSLSRACRRVPARSG